MNHDRRSRGAGLALAVLVTLAGNAPPAPGQAAAPSSPGQTSGERYKNIQVFKDLPAAQLHDAMVFMGAAVGGGCPSCHVRDADGEMTFDKDDNDHKTTARNMITMTRAVNTQHFKGEERVTCATCHQGRHEPNPVAPLSQPLTPDQLAVLAERRAAAPGPGGRGAQRPAETADQIVDKYLQAIGGRDAVARLTSRVRRGTLTNGAGQSSPVTVEESAAGLVRLTVGGTPPISRAFDGRSAWAEFGGRIRELEGVELANAALPGDLRLGLRLTDEYSALAVRAYDRANGKAVVVVEGRRPQGASETLYFDRASGLLVRRAIRLRTPLGSLPVQVDYGDYRAVDGVQTPFEVRVADWESVSTERFTDVTHNQPMDAARFAKPEAGPGR